jgi:hypothetical protein
MQKHLVIIFLKYKFEHCCLHSKCAQVSIFSTFGTLIEQVLNGPTYVTILSLQEIKTKNWASIHHNHFRST